MFKWKTKEKETTSRTSSGGSVGKRNQAYVFFCRKKSPFEIGGVGNYASALPEYFRQIVGVDVLERDITVLMPQDWNEREYSTMQVSGEEQKDLVSKIYATIDARNFPYHDEDIRVATFKAGSQMDFAGLFFAFYIIIG